MPRRTKIEAAATRQRLLDAAERVFRERGVAHASLAEVAASAGVTRGAVYWHFRDKADLFEALCERVQLPMEAMLASAGEIRQKDPLGALRTLAVNGLVRLATNAQTQAVFDVIFHKCEFAAEFGLAAGAGSDAHVPDAIGSAFVEMPDFSTAAEFLTALRAGVVVGHHWDEPRAWSARIVPSF